MKKKLLYCGMLLASMTFVSCNGNYDDWASPQTNVQEDAAAAYGVTVSAGPDAVATMPVSNDSLHIVTFSTTNSSISGYTIRKTSINGTEVKASIVGNDIVVLADEINDIVEANALSRAHKTYDLSVTTDFGANLTNGDAIAMNGTTAGSFTTATTPAEDAKGYFMLGDFNNVGWDLATPIWMTKEGNGIYKATITTKGTGSNWFKFYEGSHYSSSNWDEANLGVMGCKTNGDASLFNFVVWTGDKYEVQTPTISGQGTYDIILDVINMTYTIKRAEAKYYIVGNLQGWSTTDMSCMFSAEGGNIYSYTTKWPGAWDLKIWDSKTFGNWELAFGTAVDGDGSSSGTLINSNCNSFQAPTKNEYYTLTVDMNSQTYRWTKLDNQAPTEYANISIIGDFNSWGGDVDLKQLASSPHNWYCKATIPAKGGLKFRADHGWDVSWGTADKDTPIGDTYYLAPGTENINVPAGTYEFYLNDITGRFSIVAAN